jgi:hypothetical protein
VHTLAANSESVLLLPRARPAKQAYEASHSIASGRVQLEPPIPLASMLGLIANAVGGWPNLPLSSDQRDPHVIAGTEGGAFHFLGFQPVLSTPCQMSPSGGGSATTNASPWCKL